MKTVAGKLGVGIGLFLSAALTTGAQSTVPALVATLESSGAQYLLTLENNSAREFRGAARLSLGDEGGEQTEAGQIALALPPHETRLYLLTAIKASGQQYRLQIFDQKGVRVFYKIALVRPATAAALGQAIPISLNGAEPIAAPSAPTPAPAVPAASQAVTTPAVQVKARLLASAPENSSLLIAFDLSANSPISSATLTLSIGKTNQAKQVSLNPQAIVEFTLPNYLESNLLNYKLARLDNSVIAQGTLDVNKLFADDQVTVNDIRTDRIIYAAGETARVTVLLEGQSPHGFKLEVAARDQAGNIFFSQTATGGPGEEAREKEFSFVLPSEVKGPIIFEFKVADAETGLIFDSGERELAVKELEGSTQQPLPRK